MNSGHTIGKSILSVVAIAAPAAAALAYARLSFLPNLPYGCRHAVGPAVYGLCVALAATAFDFRASRRIIACVLVALIAMPAGGLFDALLVLYVAVITGFVAVGAPEQSFLYTLQSPAGRRAAQVLYRIVRAVVAGAFALGAFVVANLLLPQTGLCPAGGGDLTGFPGRFAFLSYAFVLPIMAMDWLTTGVD